MASRARGHHGSGGGGGGGANQMRYVNKQSLALNRAPRERVECLTAQQSFSDYDGVRRYVFAADNDVSADSPMYGKKRYTWAPIREFMSWYASAPASQRMHYELTRPTVPSKMYFDVDGKLNCDENREKANIVRANFKRDFVRFVKALAVSEEGGVKVLMARRWKSTERLSEDKVQNCAVQLCDEVFVMDASTLEKFSLHITFPNFVLENMYHCGAAMRRFEQWVVSSYGTDSEDNPYFFRVDPSENEYCFVVDRAVYTTHRVMRLPWSSKAGQKRPLMPIDKRGYVVPRFREEVFLKCLIQHTFAMPCDEHDDAFESEEDGGHHTSVVLKHGPTTDITFGVCEVRTPSDLVDVNKYSGVAQWLEPRSVGDKIIGLSRDVIRTLGLKRYIPVSELRSLQHAHGGGGGAGDELSVAGLAKLSSSSQSAVSTGDGIHLTRQHRNTNYGLKEVASVLTKKWARRTATFSDMRAPRASSDFLLMRSILSAAQDVLRDYGKGVWWTNTEGLDLYESDASRDIDIMSKSVMLKPRYLRYCEVKGDDHTHNHVYFVVYPFYKRNVGAIRQFCYSSCANVGRHFHVASTDRQLQKMKLMRARFRQLFDEQFSAVMPLPPALNDFDDDSRTGTVLRVQHVIMCAVEMTKCFSSFGRTALNNPFWDEQCERELVLQFRRYLQNMHTVSSSSPCNGASVESYDSSDDESSGDSRDDAVSEESLDMYAWSERADCSGNGVHAHSEARAIGLVDALASFVCMCAICKLNDRDYEICSRMFCLFRASMMRSSWMTFVLPKTMWHGALDAFQQRVTSWFVALNCTPDGAAQVVSEMSTLFSSTTYDMELVARFCEFIENGLENMFTELRTRMQRGSTENKDIFSEPFLESLVCQLVPYIDITK